MAILGSMRSKAWLLIGIIGVALLAFLVGDFFSGKYGSRDVNVGTIAGEDISYKDFDKKKNQVEAVFKVMYGENSGNEQMSEEIRETVWQGFVRKYAMDTRYSKLGLSVSPDELFDLVQGQNPSPLVARQFTNPQTGQFDRSALLRFLKKIKEEPQSEYAAFWAFIENELLEQRLYTKFAGLVSNAMYTTKLEAKRSVDVNAVQVAFDYFAKPLDLIADADVKVDKGDIKDFYKKNKERYKQTESRDLVFVAMPIAASPSDVKLASDYVNKLQDEFKTTEDVKQFVNLNSDVSYTDRFVKKGQLPAKLDEFAFSGSVGAFLPPYQDEAAFRMARIVAVASIPDSLKARHILLDVRAGEEAAKKRADSIVDQLHKGASFEAMAKRFSADQGSAARGGDLGWFPQGSMVKEFEDAVVASAVNDIKVVKTQYGLHIIQTTGKTAPVKKVKLAVVERGIIVGNDTRKVIYSKASALAEAADDQKSFEKYVAKHALVKTDASRVGLNDKQVSGLNSARELIRWAYDAEKGAASPVLEVDNHFVVAVLTGVHEDGYATLEEVAPEITFELRRQKKAELLAKKIQISGANLAEVAAKNGAQIASVPEANFGAYFLPGLGVEPKVIAAAVTAPQGKIVGPIQGTNAVYVLQSTAKTSNAAMMNVDAERQRISSMVAQRAAYELYQSMFELAEVKDLRGKYLF